MIRIIIAEDQELLLGVIGALLNLEEDMEVIGKATNGQEAIALVHELHPDICIMDIEMPVMNGLDAADALISSDCRIIIMTTFARIGYVERAQKAGVRGYLLKDSPSKDLIRSIRSIMNGKIIYSPELIDHDTSNVGEGVETFSEFQNDTNYRRNNPFRNVRKYFSTIIDKMKLPTG